MCIRDRFVGYTTVDQPLVPKILHDKDLAIQDLKNHFYTRIGERVMDPDFGSIIPMMVFEPMDDLSISEIQADAERIIGLDPRWSLLDLNIIENNNSLTVQLKLSYLNRNEEDLFLAYERDIQ